MRHKALAAHPGILVSRLIATSFLCSARAGVTNPVTLDVGLYDFFVELTQ